MGLGVGIFLAAAGAVLAFAVTDTVSGVDIHAIGWILLIVGIIGVVLSMIFWSSWQAPAIGVAGARRTWTRAPKAPATTRPTSEHERRTGAAGAAPRFGSGA